MSNQKLYDEWHEQYYKIGGADWPEWLESELLKARTELAAGNHLHAQATDKINDLEAEVARLKALSAWVPVSERLPAEGDEFLAFNAEEEYDRGAFIAIMFDGVFYLCDSQTLTNVTHWMPLPAAPEPDEAQP